ncbi:CLUMA_CG006179, isoform A [Clunio marinus]|uniref:CLUMA_CG006179, isoform A n=1 Tax=Clunio marinus TaxID=568069 RepID=A0A1J1I2N3_9DIPT|nr:CLUMA_CG006179, isoform A [Clunio marinus]
MFQFHDLDFHKLLNSQKLSFAKTRKQDNRQQLPINIMSCFNFLFLILIIFIVKTECEVEENEAFYDSTIKNLFKEILDYEYPDQEEIVECMAEHLMTTNAEGALNLQEEPVLIIPDMRKKIDSYVVIAEKHCNQKSIGSILHNLLSSNLYFCN